MHRASLNESAAAGALLLAGWPAAAAQGVSLVPQGIGEGVFLCFYFSPLGKRRGENLSHLLSLGS